MKSLGHSLVFNTKAHQKDNLDIIIQSQVEYFSNAFIFVCVYSCLHICLWNTFMRSVPKEAGRGCQVPLGLESQLWAFMWLLEIKPRSSWQLLVFFTTESSLQHTVGVLTLKQILNSQGSGWMLWIVTDLPLWHGGYHTLPLGELGLCWESVIFQAWDCYRPWADTSQTQWVHSLHILELCLSCLPAQWALLYVFTSSLFMGAVCVTVGSSCALSFALCIRLQLWLLVTSLTSSLCIWSLSAALTVLLCIPE